MSNDFPAAACVPRPRSFVAKSLAIKGATSLIFSVGIFSDTSKGRLFGSEIFSVKFSINLSGFLWAASINFSTTSFSF